MQTKWNYLRRDAYFAGVAYGSFDLDKIVDSFLVHRAANASFLAIDDSARFAVSQLVNSKHLMHQQVYSHRARLITDAMIVRGLRLAVETDEQLREAYTYGSRKQLERYLALDDDRLDATILDGPDARAASIYARLRNRRLYKQVSVIYLDERGVRDSTVRLALMDLGRPDMEQFERAVATEVLHCEPWEVVVEKKSIKNPMYSAPGVIDPEAIHVVGSNGEVKLLTEYKDIALGQQSATEFIMVIGPMDRERHISDETWTDQHEKVAAKVKDLIVGTSGGLV